MQDFDEKAKDSFSDHIIDASENSQPSSAPQKGNGEKPSKPQLDYLLALGYDGSEGAVNTLSKIKASNLIGKLLEKQNQSPKQGALQ